MLIICTGFLVFFFVCFFAFWSQVTRLETVDFAALLGYSWDDLQCAQPGAPPCPLAGPPAADSRTKPAKGQRLHLTEDGSHWWILHLLNEVKATDLGPFMVLLVHSISPSQTAPLIQPIILTIHATGDWRTRWTSLENSDRKLSSITTLEV